MNQNGNQGDCPPSKRPNSGKLKIGTHNGTFHCDEVLACFMLRQLPKYEHAEIVRTRDNTLLDTCDVVVDVGGLFDHKRLRFDHHQRTFSHTMNTLNPQYKWRTKLSSAGLVYYHFGKEILRHVLRNEELREHHVDVLYKKMYENFIEEIDAIDNGVDQFDGEPKYKVTTNLSSRVQRCNPLWTDEKPDETASFFKAYEMVGEEFLGRMLNLTKSWIPARSIIQEALDKRFQIDPSGEIIHLKQFCPWKEHLFNIEEENNLIPQVKFVIYEDTAGNARIQCVPAGKNTFENRLSICTAWCGLRGQDLSNVCGVKDCIFVHMNGFIGGNKSVDGALEMARKVLKSR